MHQLSTSCDRLNVEEVLLCFLNNKDQQKIQDAEAESTLKVIKQVIISRLIDTFYYSQLKNLKQFTQLVDKLNSCVIKT